MKKYKILALSAILAMSVGIAHAAEKPATQAYGAPINVTLGYANNDALGKDGLRTEIGTEVNGVRFGATSLTSEDRVETYGGYVGIPYKFYNTKVNIVPRLEVEKYREVDETIGSAGVAVEYQMTPNVQLMLCISTAKLLTAM